MDTVTLWRPAGPEELALVEASGWRKWPLNASIAGTIKVIVEFH
jgi:hypothetical protein